MATFRSQLVDRDNYIPECWLDRVFNQQVIRELNGQNSYTFDIPIQDIYYPYIKHRKYIRLHDLDLDRIHTTISTGTGTKQITVADSTGLKIGDYITIYETTENNWSAQANAITGAADLTVTFSNDSGILYPTTGTRYIKIWDDVTAEKTVATNVFARRPESEPLEISSVTSTTFVADVGFDYNAGAYLFQPGRSFVAKITNINGNVLTLSRKDFDPQTSARIEKVNYTSYRISEITEKRESSLPIATIRCNHLQYDLNDTVYFKNARLSVSAGTHTFSSAFTDRIDIDTFLDTVLIRQVDSDGDPLTLQSFIKGDLVRFRYNKGLIDTAASTTATIINGFVDEDAVHIASGSTLSIKGESSVFTVAHQSNTDFAILTLTAAASNTTGDDDVEYQVISKGIYTGDEIIGTANVGHNSNIVESSSITLNDGTVAHGAVFQVEDSDKIYFVDYVNTATSLVLTENIIKNDEADKDNANFRIKRDERELKINTGVKLLGALRQMVETFSDDRQQIHFEVNEDRSIDIIKKPDTDDMDPTSDLVVRYQDGLVKNLKGITREFDIADFTNRIIPQGSTSGWSNVASGITGTITKDQISGALTTDSADDKEITDSNATFSTDSVTMGMWIIITKADPTDDGAPTATGMVTGVVSETKLDFDNGILDIGGEADAYIPQDTDTYVVDFGNNRNQFRLSAGDAKKFRIGDPVQIFQDRDSFTINSASQITVDRALSGTATGGNTTEIDDTTRTGSKAFDNAGATNLGAIVVGMRITNTNTSKNNASGYITTVASTKLTCSGNFVDVDASKTDASGTSYDFDASDTYRISLVSQRIFEDDASSFTDHGPAAEHSNDSFNVLPVTPATNDAMYFGSSQIFERIGVNLSTVGAHSLTMVWEYYDGTTWSTLTFDLQEIDDFSTVSAAGKYVNKFQAPTDWATTSVNSVTAYWVRARVSAFSSASTRPIATQVWVREWQENKFTGGYITITSGEAVGELRNIVSNTMDTITVSRRWDKLPINSVAIASKRTGFTGVRGFGYRRVKVDESTTNSVTVYNTPLTEHAYRNGLLVVSQGPCEGQRFKISDNTLVDADSDGITEDSLIEIDSSQGLEFNPLPAAASFVEIIAMPQMVEEYIATTASGVFRFFSGYITVSPIPLGPLFQGVYNDDLWNGGTLYITSGTDSGDSYVIADTLEGNYLRLTTGSTQYNRQDDGGAFTDFDAASLNETADDVDLLPAVPVANDAFYFGSTTQFNHVSMRISTAGAGTWTVGWDYWDGSAWSTLSFTSQGIDDFTEAAGIYTNTFTQPTDWATTSVNSVSAYWVRANVDAFTSITTQPQATWVFNNGWPSGTEPADDESFILVNETDLPMAVLEGLEFTPTAGDEIVLLMKESNTPLNVGKYNSFRSTIVSATRSTITVQSGEGSRFAKNMIIFVGAQDISSSISLSVTRGDQSTGIEYTISSISSDVLTLAETINPVPQPGDHVEIIGFVDATSIIKNNIVESVFSRTDLNDPKQLYDAANEYLQKVTTIKPRYTINFVDMYEVDRDEFRFDSYQLGDTITVIDNQVTGPEGINTIRVLREEFDPSFPPDKTNTLEAGKQSQRQIDDYITTLYQNQLTQQKNIDRLRFELNAPKCVWWDDRTNACTKLKWPNVFCNSASSNEDGRTDRDGNIITKERCQSYAPPNANIVGSQTAQVQGVQATITTVDNDTFDDTNRAPIDVPFVLSDSSYCFVLDITDDAAPTSQIDVGIATCRIQVDDDGNIVPYQVGGEEMGLGGWVQVRRVSGALTLTVVVEVHATGNVL